MTDYLQKHNVTGSEAVFDALLEAGILRQLAETFFVGSLGQKVWLLLSAINGADLTSVVDHLLQTHPSVRPYELVTEGITTGFISDLARKPDFRRIYFCSPWVHLREKSRRKLLLAVHRAQLIHGEKSKIEIIVIARPLQVGHSGYEAFKETFSLLAGLGAEIVVNPAIHAKLYIREPGPRGGLTHAIVSSENLTGATNIELGIRITNDTSIIRKLILWFFDIYASCQPIELER